MLTRDGSRLGQSILGGITHWYGFWGTGGGSALRAALLEQEGFKEKVLLQPSAEQPRGEGGTAHAAAWLIRLLSISADAGWSGQGAALLWCWGSVGDLTFTSPRLRASHLPCTQRRRELLWRGRGSVPIWPETWQTHFVPAAVCPEGVSCSGVGMGVPMAAPLGRRGRWDPGLRARAGAPFPGRTGGKAHPCPREVGGQLHKGSFSCLGRVGGSPGCGETFPPLSPQGVCRVQGGQTGGCRAGGAHPDLSLPLRPRGTPWPVSPQPCQPHG